MSINFQLLQAKLKDFGLNPTDWTLEPPAEIGNLFQLRVRHLHQSDFILVGWTDREAWLDLSYQG